MVLKKAQAGMEFIILVGFLMIAFAVFFLVIKENMTEKLEERTNTRLKEIGLTVKNEITLAGESTDGYRRNFTIPEKIYNEDYTIEIYEGTIRIAGSGHQLVISTYNVTGQLNKNKNNITKENGEIKLNQ